MFILNAEGIERAYKDLHVHGPPDGGWDNIAPNISDIVAQQERKDVYKKGVSQMSNMKT